MVSKLCQIGASDKPHEKLTASCTCGFSCHKLRHFTWVLLVYSYWVFAIDYACDDFCIYRFPKLKINMYIFPNDKMGHNFSMYFIMTSSLFVCYYYGNGLQ